jgi:hypothetical protein
MKKALWLSVGLTLLSASLMAAYTYGQCQAIAKSTGQRCKRGVSAPGDIYCFQHK